jgi:hypothetical protein
MARKGISKRALVLLVASLFLASAEGRAFGAHRCPHHDIPAATTETAEHDAHGSHATEGVTEPSAGSEHDAHGPCSCIGQCSASSSPAVATAGSITGDLAEVWVRGAAAISQDQVVPLKPVFLIPFAHGPPAQFAA